MLGPVEIFNMEPLHDANTFFETTFLSKPELPILASGALGQELGMSIRRVACKHGPLMLRACYLVSILTALGGDNVFCVFALVSSHL